MIFFKNLTLSNSPFYSAKIEEIHLADPHPISRKMLRRRASQTQAYEDHEEVASPHAFVLRRGNKGVMRFEIPSELNELWTKSFERAYGGEQIHQCGEELLQEKFALLYHEGEYDRIDALLLSPISPLFRTMGSSVIDVGRMLLQVEDEPITRSLLVLKNFRAWRKPCSIEVERGHIGYPHIELPEILFQTGHPLGEPCVTLWFDRDSCSLLMLKNSAKDAIDNMNIFGTSCDFSWDGLQSYQADWAASHLHHDLNLLPILPDPWRRRLSLT